MQSGYDTCIDPSWKNPSATPQYQHSTRWNERFQAAFDLPLSTPAERLERAKQIYLIYEEFVAAAAGYGRTIIQEFHIPANKKTISSVNLGIAGGLKFFHEGIFFKVATDAHTIYGGDYFSAKAAGHEIKAFNELMASSEKQPTKLRFSMMTTIDYFGHRLIAVAFLPISSQTILYGSPNGGRLIYKEDAELNSLIESIANSLFLKLHMVGEGISQNPTPLALPADAEGHLGTDGRYYLVDVPRLFPAEREHTSSFAIIIPVDQNEPTKSIWIDRRDWNGQITHYMGQSVWIEHKFADQLLITYSDYSEKRCSQQLNKRASAITGSPLFGRVILARGEKVPARGETFYFMLRPELLQECKVPLSSDTFTKFGRHSSPLHEKEVSQLVSFLLNEKIPKFVNWLVANSHLVVSSLHLPNVLHDEGINLRYLGLIFKLIPETHPRLKYHVVGFNMIGRVINDLLQNKLRSLKLDSFSGFKEALVDFCNLVLGRGPESDTFWTYNVPIQVELKHGPFGYEYDPNKSRSFKSMLGRLMLFAEMQHYTGVKFRPSCARRYMGKNKQGSPDIPLHKSDIVAVEPKIKKWRWSVRPFIQEAATVQTTAKLEQFQNNPGLRDAAFNTALDLLTKAESCKQIPQEKSNRLLFEVESLRTHVSLCTDIFTRKSIETAASIFKLAAKYNAINAIDLAIETTKIGATIFCELGAVSCEICLSCLFICGLILEKSQQMDSAEVLFKIILNQIEELFDSAENFERASPVEIELHHKLLPLAVAQGDSLAVNFHTQRLENLNTLFPHGQAASQNIILGFLDFSNLSGIVLDCTNEWKDFLASRLNSINGLTPPVRKRIKYEIT